MSTSTTRAATAAAFAALVLAASAAPAAAARPQEPPRGLACADIVDGGAGYTTEDGTIAPTVLAEAVLAAPACSRITYSLVVFDEAGDTTPLTTLSGVATTDAAGRNIVRFTTEVVQEPGDTTVCVAFRTTQGNRVLDLAPDSGCEVLVLDPVVSPGRNFR